MHPEVYRDENAESQAQEQAEQRKMQEAKVAGQRDQQQNYD